VIFINEVRCLNCKKLLYKSKLGQNTRIECKCSRCGAINIKNFDRLPEIIPVVKNMNRKIAYVTAEICKQKIIDELSLCYSNLIIKSWEEINSGGFIPFTRCVFEGTLISKK